MLTAAVCEERPHRRRQVRRDQLTALAARQRHLAAEYVGVLGHVVERDRQVERSTLGKADERHDVERR